MVPPLSSIDPSGRNPSHRHQVLLRLLGIGVTLVSVGAVMALVSSARQEARKAQGKNNSVTHEQGDMPGLTPFSPLTVPTREALARSASSRPSPSVRSVQHKADPGRSADEKNTELPTVTVSGESASSGWNALNGGQYATARAWARDCLGADPLDVDCHRVLTQSFTRQGEYGSELDVAIDDCLAVYPEEAQCMEAKVLAELGANNISSARDWLARREALSDQPPDYIGRALIAESQGDLSGACDAYRDACRFMQPYACKRVEAECSTTNDAPN
jgi:hypothetical protein